MLKYQNLNSYLKIFHKINELSLYFEISIIIIYFCNFMSTLNSVTGYYPGLAAAFLATLAISSITLALNKYSLHRLTKRFNYFTIIREKPIL